MNDDVVDLRHDESGNQVITTTGDAGALVRRIAELEDENSELRLQLAVLGTTDAATGLANRIGLLDAIEMATYRLARMNEPFAVVLMGFPQLASLDDAEERLEAIRDIGSLLAAGVRSVDKVARLETSTFISVLSNIPFEHIDIVLERTRDSLAAIDDRIVSRVLAVSLTDASTAPGAEAILDRCQELINDSASADIVRL